MVERAEGTTAHIPAEWHATKAEVVHVDMLDENQKMPLGDAFDATAIIAAPVSPLRQVVSAVAVSDIRSSLQGALVLDDSAAESIVSPGEEMDNLVTSVQATPQEALTILVTLNTDVNRSSKISAMTPSHFGAIVEAVSEAQQADVAVCLANMLITNNIPFTCR